MSDNNDYDDALILILIGLFLFFIGGFAVQIIAHMIYKWHLIN